MKNIIKVLRATHNLSQEKLAEILNITRPTLSNIELGKTEPSGRTVIKCANYFHLPAEQIFFDEDVIHVEQLSA
jgi:putative transcriptional regulator